MNLPSSRGEGGGAQFTGELQALRAPQLSVVLASSETRAPGTLGQGRTLVPGRRTAETASPGAARLPEKDAGRGLSLPCGAPGS